MNRSNFIAFGALGSTTRPEGSTWLTALRARWNGSARAVLAIRSRKAASSTWIAVLPAQKIGTPPGPLRATSSSPSGLRSLYSMIRSRPSTETTLPTLSRKPRLATTCVDSSEPLNR